MASAYSKNNLLRKLAKTQRNLPTTASNSGRKFLIRKAEKYVTLLEKMELEPLEEFINMIYPTNSAQESLTIVKTPRFEVTYDNPSAAGYKVVQTVGDGDCLIHALLTAISPSYRRIPFRERSAVGGAVRRDYIAPKIDDPEDRAFFESGEYLEDSHILLLGNMFHYNFIIFNDVPKRHKRQNLPPNATSNITFLDIEEGRPWVLLHNKLSSSRVGDHYSAVQGSDGALKIQNYAVGLAAARALSRQEAAEPRCAFSTDEIVIYRGNGYIIEERKFDGGDPPTCITVNLKNLDTGGILTNIPVRDIEKMAGGGGKQQRKTRRQRKTRSIQKLNL
jgi:hypothetical protein